MRRIALGRGEALMAVRPTERSCRDSRACSRTGARRVVRDEPQLGSRLAHGEHRRRTGAAVTSIVCGGPERQACGMLCGDAQRAAPPGSCVVVVALDQAARSPAWEVTTPISRME